MTIPPEIPDADRAAIAAMPERMRARVCGLWLARNERMTNRVPGAALKSKRAVAATKVPAAVARRSKERPKPIVRELPCVSLGPLKSHCRKNTWKQDTYFCNDRDSPYRACRPAFECGLCDRYRAPPADEFVRHLLYFVFPVAGNGVWQRNVDQILERMPLFNGSRTVAIASHTGDVVHPLKPGADGSPIVFHLDPPEAVRAAFAGHDVRFLDIPNSDGGESAAFFPLWESVERHVGPNDVTFYAHAKGVTYDDASHPAHRWAGLLYEANLDYWPLVAEQLKTFPVTGALRRKAPHRVNRRTGRVRPGRVHYSGTFFWFANQRTFKKRWKRCREKWGGIEAWPGRVFEAPLCGCIFHEEPPDRTAYDPVWLDGILNDFKEWAEEHRRCRTPS